MAMQEISRRLSDGMRELLERTTIKEDANTDNQFLERRREALEKEIEGLTITEHRRIGLSDACPCGSNSTFGECCGKRLIGDERIAQ